MKKPDGGAREGAPSSLLTDALILSYANPGAELRIRDNRLNRSGTIVALPEGEPHGVVVIQWDRSYSITGVRVSAFKHERYAVSLRKR